MKKSTKVVVLKRSKDGYIEVKIEGRDSGLYAIWKLPYGIHLKSNYKGKGFAIYVEEKIDVESNRYNIDIVGYGCLKYELSAISDLCLRELEVFMKVNDMFKHFKSDREEVKKLVMNSLTETNDLFLFRDVDVLEELGEKSLIEEILKVREINTKGDFILLVM